MSIEPTPPSVLHETLPDVIEHRGRRLDAQPSTDDNSLSFPIRAFLGSTPIPEVKRRRKVHRRGTLLDQGQEGACVGHGVVADLVGDPVRVDFRKRNVLAAASYDDPTTPRNAQAAAFWLYRAAQRDDETPGEEYSGTSVNAGMKVARNQGLITGWRWGRTKADLVDSLLTLGPVVLAMPWHDGMYEAPGGELIPGDGEYVGWHCILANGYDPALRTDSTLTRDVGHKREMIRLLNSWGPTWGTNGQAWADADRLFEHIDNAGGDMAIALGRNAVGVLPTV